MHTPRSRRGLVWQTTQARESELAAIILQVPCSSRGQIRQRHLAQLAADALGEIIGQLLQALAEGWVVHSLQADVFSTDRSLHPPQRLPAAVAITSVYQPAAAV